MSPAGQRTGQVRPFRMVSVCELLEHKESRPPASRAVSFEFLPSQRRRDSEKRGGVGVNLYRQPVLAETGPCRFFWLLTVLEGL